MNLLAWIIKVLVCACMCVCVYVCNFCSHTQAITETNDEQVFVFFPHRFVYCYKAMVYQWSTVRSKCRVTAHRLWYVAKQGFVSLYRLRKATVTV